MLVLIFDKKLEMNPLFTGPKICHQRNLCLSFDTFTVPWKIFLCLSSRKHHSFHPTSNKHKSHTALGNLQALVHPLSHLILTTELESTLSPFYRERNIAKIIYHQEAAVTKVDRDLSPRYRLQHKTERNMFIFPISTTLC